MSTFTTKTAYVSLITLALTCLASLPALLAVSPPPDGGYPGGNTAEGQNALFSLRPGDLTPRLVCCRFGV